MASTPCTPSTPSQSLDTTSMGLYADLSKPRKSSFYYEQIKLMFNSELYSNVLTFSNWAMSLEPRNLEDIEILIEPEECHVHIMCGDAAYRLLDFHRAEHYYTRSLQMIKPLLKSFPSIKSKLQEDCGTNTDLKYKIYLCLLQCKKTNEALKTLQSIPAKQRNVQINMALGNLYKQTGMERAAMTCYKEVLKTCPMALEAVEQLLKLGCNEDDVQSLVRDKTTKHLLTLDWYNNWIRGTAAVAARDNLTGIKIFKDIRQRYLITPCVSLLYSLGVANTNYGDYTAAIEAFKLAHHYEPMNMQGMDMYAFVLWHEEMQQELYRLMTRLNECNMREAKSEPWIASAYYTLSINRLNRAQIFALRGSTFMGAKNMEGMIAQGHVFLKMKKYQEAVECFREVMARNPERLEAHRGIVECYLATARGREAMTVAIGALKSVGHSPRVFNLCATALRKDPLTVTKAKAYLEKALEVDDSFLPAIMNFVDIYESEGKYNEGIQFLKGYINRRVNPCKVHIRLAALLSRNGMDNSAADQYNIVLKLDPWNREAKEGLSRLDPSSSRTEGSFELGEEMDVEDEEEEDADHADTELDTSIWEDYGLTHAFYG